MYHCIFDYNYENSWQILIIFVPLETWMNVLPSNYRLSDFNLTMSPLYQYQIKLKISKKSFNVRFFPCLLVFLAVFWQKKFYIFMGFYQKFIFKLNVVNFNM